MQWFEHLDKEQERKARANADMSEGALYVTIVALLMVAAFSFYMALTERVGG